MIPCHYLSCLDFFPPPKFAELQCQLCSYLKCAYLLWVGWFLALLPFYFLQEHPEIAAMKLPFQKMRIFWALLHCHLLEICPDLYSRYSTALNKHKPSNRRMVWIGRDHWILTSKLIFIRIYINKCVFPVETPQCSQILVTDCLFLTLSMPIP